MTKGWAGGLKAVALAAVLSFGTLAIAQDAPAVPTAATVSAATVSTAATMAPESGDVPPAALAAAQHSAAKASAVAGYDRTRPTPGIGMPVPAGIALQDQFTPVGREAKAMVENLLNPLMAIISIFVLALMIYTFVRFRAAANPTPSTTTHNFTIEVVWTLVPALILLFIAFPSFRLLANQYSPPKADLTVKVTGHQWYWEYEYPDYGAISFDSVQLSEEEAKKAGEPYMLEVDNRLVVPVGKTVKVLVTAADVLHSFAMPSFWVKMDAVPGKINETWFKVDRPGVYYGQCSELCGTKHAFMPIAIEVMTEENFRRWVRMKQAQDGIEPTGPGIAIAPTPLTPAQVAGAVRAAVTPTTAPSISSAVPAPAGAPAA